MIDVWHMYMYHDIVECKGSSSFASNHPLETEQNLNDNTELPIYEYDNWDYIYIYINIYGISTYTFNKDGSSLRYD